MGYHSDWLSIFHLLGFLRDMGEEGFLTEARVTQGQVQSPPRPFCLQGIFLNASFLYDMLFDYRTEGGRI